MPSEPTHNEQKKEIKLENISKFYALERTKVMALHDVNLEIEAGELVAIVGASGSGKSTLMNIIGLLDRPNEGHYFLQGQDVTTLSDIELAKIRNRTIGFVFQSFYLLPRLNVIENIGLPLYYRKMEEKEIDQQALMMLEKLGIAKLRYHRPNQLSLGQQQRVAIARALIGNPLILLADEPTGSLDTHASKRVVDLFVELNLTEKVTTVIITHDLGVAVRCRRMVQIEDGKLLNV